MKFSFSRKLFGKQLVAIYMSLHVFWWPVQAHAVAPAVAVVAVAALGSVLLSSGVTQYRAANNTSGGHTALYGKTPLGALGRAVLAVNSATYSAAVQLGSETIEAGVGVARVGFDAMVDWVSAHPLDFPNLTAAVDASRASTTNPALSPQVAQCQLDTTYILEGVYNSAIEAGAAQAAAGYIAQAQCGSAYQSGEYSSWPCDGQPAGDAFQVKYYYCSGGNGVHGYAYRDDAQSVTGPPGAPSPYAFDPNFDAPGGLYGPEIDKLVKDCPATTVVGAGNPAETDNAPPVALPSAPATPDSVVRDQALSEAQQRVEDWDQKVKDLKAQLANDPTNVALQQQLMTAEAALSQAKQDVATFAVAKETAAVQEAEKQEAAQPIAIPATPAITEHPHDFAARIASFRAVVNSLGLTSLSIVPPAGLSSSSQVVFNGGTTFGEHIFDFADYTPMYAIIRGFIILASSLIGVRIVLLKR